MIELPVRKKTVRSKASGKKLATPSSGRYILQSIIPIEYKLGSSNSEENRENNTSAYGRCVDWPEEDEKFNGVVGIVLSLVFLNNGVATLDTLLNRLENTQLPQIKFINGEDSSATTRLSVNVDSRALAQEFISYIVKLDYLTTFDTGLKSGAAALSSNNNHSLSQAGADRYELDPSVEYCWGPRAMVEYDSESISMFIAALMEVPYDSDFIEKIKRSCGTAF
ncbi:hypothetical protein AYI70_g7785 [Smittium culicis]|uniref:MAGE domain-containing protein n=1 Tax=Smittium culicis TaxID=133412 RepID=A0A1R1XGN4_9FUNG|nr:hypothetical protein AYI70_g8293 [Smittium culicis]OMJ14600.1 hypothetical protein AYI70_g7785 [Smittium culicis]